MTRNKARARVVVCSACAKSRGNRNSQHHPRRHTTTSIVGGGCWSAWEVAMNEHTAVHHGLLRDALLYYAVCQGEYTRTRHWTMATRRWASCSRWACGPPPSYLPEAASTNRSRAVNNEHQTQTTDVVHFPAPGAVIRYAVLPTPTSPP